MTTIDESTESRDTPPDTRWYSLSVDDTVSRLHTDPTSGLGTDEITSRLATADPFVGIATNPGA